MVESFSRTGLPTQEKSVINKFKKDYRNKALNEYHIKSHWHVKGDAGEIVDMMGDVSSLTKLWPAAFLKVDELDSGDEEGRGRIVRLCTTGWLPYTLEWYFRVVNVETPTRYTLEIWGDFSGKGNGYLISKVNGLILHSSGMYTFRNQSFGTYLLYFGHYS